MDVHDPARSGRPGGVRAVTGALALALLVTAVGCSDSPRPATDGPGTTTSAAVDGSPAPPSEPAAPGTSVSPADLPDVTLAAVEKGSDTFFDTFGKVLGQPDGTDVESTAPLPGVTGAALEEMLNTAAEYQVNGWRIDGRPVVVRQDVVSATRDPDQVVVRACVDNSSVRVLDANGGEVPNSRPPRPRTRNILTLVREGDSWAVDAYRPAVRPNC
ncbi:hypothetical protein [Nocardioides jishulii]|uniref:Uncharacterized protein n=1 Tax=Nocardioides jishulii TaxID=2575440 RepID=A0A4U2YJ58_9ACTN|nr:hypothetical protein [Nocardioides jishulii]QCX26648.1 hypothetical protein FCL41_03125 [Nocardioides jishulii]TKI60382.1 hypothetical protein FC770_16425 [Nocardioides jishulii]